METKKITMEQLAPVIEETLKSGGTFEIAVKGTSMLPLLVEGRDTVVLGAVSEPLKKDDIPFYRRPDGAYVLHRVRRAEDGVYTMCGDNQWVEETGVLHSQVIGKVISIRRKGREFPVASKRYRFYCAFWRALFPVRKYIVKIRGKLKK